MLPNWFLALPVDADIIATLPPVPPGFRCFHPEDVHMTLSFLGACGESAALRALAEVEAALAARPTTPFDVSLGEVVPMGPKSRYSALSGVVHQGHEVAVDFMRKFRDIGMDAALVNRDKRAPLPHVTVARPQRRATDEQRELGLAWAKTVALPSEPIRLDRVALYTWSERRLPRLFQIVGSCPLARRGDC